MWTPATHDLVHYYTISTNKYLVTTKGIDRVICPSVSSQSLECELEETA